MMAIKLPRLLFRASDGGKDSGVTGYFLIEWKPCFSIVLLHFREGTREAYHSHAFNAWTYWIRGHVMEVQRNGSAKFFWRGHTKFTPRECFHKVHALRSTWALSLRGPWASTWQEDRNGQLVTLTHGRAEVRI